MDDSMFYGSFGTCQPTGLAGNGRLDIYVAEMGPGEREDEPQMLDFRDQNAGDFEETPMDRGMTPHEAKEINMNDNGMTDIAGKSYRPDHHVDVWHNDG